MTGWMGSLDKITVSKLELVNAIFMARLRLRKTFIDAGEMET